MRARSSASPGLPATARRSCCSASSRRAAPRLRRHRGRRAPVALVAGDRQTDGIFPLWSIAENIGIRSIAGAAARAPHLARSASWSWPRAGASRISIRTPDVRNNILSLSGGNQQKALFARALGSDAQIVLMDDPMRGVDVGTKLEVYDLIRAEARPGPHLPLVHDRDRRTRELRPRLCLPQRPHRRRRSAAAS